MSIAADRALAEDPTTSDAVLIGLLSHRDWHVRWSAAQNPSAGDGVRLAALATGDRDLAAAVGQLGDALSVEVRDAIFGHPRREGRESLALYAKDRATLDRLAADADPKVRAAVAQPDHRPADLMRLLARDRRAEVRGAVAASTTIPDDLALELLADRSAVVRWSLLTMRDGDLRFARALVDDPDEMNRSHARITLFHAGEVAEYEARSAPRRGVSGVLAARRPRGCSAAERGGVQVQCVVPVQRLVPPRGIDRIRLGT